MWATVARSGLSVLLFWILLLRRFPKDNLGKLFIKILKYIGAAIASYMSGHFIVQLLAFIPAIFQLAVSGLLSVVLYIVLLYFLDIEMLQSILELVGARFFLNHLQKIRDLFFQRKPYLGRRS